MLVSEREVERELDLSGSVYEVGQAPPVGEACP